MAPVTIHGINHTVTHAHQLLATMVTAIVAALAVAAVLRWSWRNRQSWPLIVLLSGFTTFLCEPMFDHYYGLWFYTDHQWNAVVTYGIHVPIWLPIVYIPYYGAWTVYLQRRFTRGVTMRQLGLFLIASACLATLAEQLYIQVWDLYGYQTHQPFAVSNYPVLVAIINGLPPFLAAIIYARLVPRLTGWWSLSHLAVVPIAFCAGSSGAAWLYLADRQSDTRHPSMVLLDITMISAVVFGVGMVFAAAKLAGIDGGPQPEAAEPLAAEVPAPDAVSAIGERRLIPA